MYVYISIYIYLYIYIVRVCLLFYELKIDLVATTTNRYSIISIAVSQIISFEKHGEIHR